jgi:hypothetical protein
MVREFKFEKNNIINLFAIINKFLPNDSNDYNGKKQYIYILFDYT